MHNLRRLIDIAEAFSDEEDDARLDRERNIVTLIHTAFARLGLGIEEHGISYDESDRLAVVTLEDEPAGWPIDKLAGLYESGLSEHFVVGPSGSNNVEIRFTVNSDLDHAAAPRR